jgi:hypothetical protein
LYAISIALNIHSICCFQKVCMQLFTPDIKLTLINDRYEEKESVSMQPGHFILIMVAQIRSAYRDCMKKPPSIGIQERLRT